MSWDEDYPLETRAVLVYGHLVDDASFDAITAINEAIHEDLLDDEFDIQLVVGVDVESTDEDDYEMVPVVAGVVIREVYGENDHEQGLTFAQLQSKIIEADSRVRALSPKVEGVVDELGLSMAEPALHLVCSGWLASAWLVKGVWVPDSHPMIDDLDDGEFDTTPGLYVGTDGSTQEDYPGGGAYGVLVESESFDGAGAVEVVVDKTRDRILDDALNADPLIDELGLKREYRYYVISCYD